MESATEIQLPDHVTTKERNRICFHESVTTRERINLKSFPVNSSCSLSVTYQKNRRFRNGDLSGHLVPLLSPLRYDPEPKLQVLDHEIPTLFLVTEEIFLDHLTMVLSETCLSSSIQERLATTISKLETTETRSDRRGFVIQVEIKVDVDHVVHIGSGCMGREACPWLVSDRYLAKRVTGRDCPICLTELSGAVCRMELRCSHVFHKSCVMEWFKKNTSCPLCRAEAIGETVFIY